MGEIVKIAVTEVISLARRQPPPNGGDERIQKLAREGRNAHKQVFMATSLGKGAALPGLEYEVVGVPGIKGGMGVIRERPYELRVDPELILTSQLDMKAEGGNVVVEEKSGMKLGHICQLAINCLERAEGRDVKYSLPNPTAVVGVLHLYKVKRSFVLCEGGKEEWENLKQMSQLAAEIIAVQRERDRGPAGGVRYKKGEKIVGLAEALQVLGRETGSRLCESLVPLGAVGERGEEIVYEAGREILDSFH